MSGPEDRRGTDGGEHPLDVDARFADIIAHFHDDEPSRPRVVDGYDDGPGSQDPAGPTDAPDANPTPDGGEGAGSTGTAATGATDPTRTAAPGGPGPDVASSPDPEADLAALRREYEARVAAEVDRAVDGADGGHFVPDEPPPLPRPDLPGRIAWAAVLVGPVLLLLCAMLWRTAQAPSWLLGAIVTAVVAGFGYLVWRLPRSGDRDDRGDGAIV
ncbi:hypothetical protein [Jannaschia sp. R86511]|uniref:hypothetical protein n=1 Tax=Jannaschia sp. R86511 TaxID=3093853 RepID=UPI0036D2EA3A